MHRGDGRKVSRDERTEELEKSLARDDGRVRFGVLDRLEQGMPKIQEMRLCRFVFDDLRAVLEEQEVRLE
jgi:hypothetical protein